jgi:membrane protein
MSVRTWIHLMAVALDRALKVGVMDLAAAIAFNTLLSLAPLLLLLLGAASRLLGNDRAREQLLATVGVVAGPGAIPAAEAVVDLVGTGRTGTLGTVLGVLIMASFASAVFLQLRSAMDRIWDAAPLGFGRALLARLASLTYVAIALSVVMLFMVMGLVVAVAAPIVAGWLPSGAQLWSVATTAVFSGLLTFALALLFRHGPRVPVPWHCVWGGAALTALLFFAGNLIIGLLLGRSVLVTLYGGAGSLVVALLWVYYAAQIVLFGACFTRVYAEHCSRGQRVQISG